MRFVARAKIELKSKIDRENKKRLDEFEASLLNGANRAKYLKLKGLKVDYGYLKADKRDTKKIEAEIEKLKADILKTTKKPVKFVNCNKCNDRFAVNGQMCICLKDYIKVISGRAFSFSPENIKEFREANTNIINNSVGLKNAYLFFRQETDKDENKYLNYLLHGKSGVGKTYLLKCLLGENILKNKDVYYISAFDLNALMLKYHTSFFSEREGLFTELLEADFLFIDDFGTEQIIRNVTLEYFLDILNSRIENGKKTYLTTNLSPAQLNTKYGERISSRLLDKKNSIVIDIDTKDLRKA